MVIRGITSIVIIGLFFFIVPTIVLAVDQSITFTLDEPKEKHQFIIEGEGDFEVQLELPNGTIVDYEEFDPDQYMYFGLENKRMWIVDNAKTGTYTFHISSSSKEDRFSITDKESIEQPTITWGKPLKEKVSISAGDSLELSWKVDGDISKKSNNIQFYVKPEDGWYLIPVDTATTDHEEATISMPSDLLGGAYHLIVEIDDEFMVDSIDPEVVIDYKNEDKEEIIAEVVQQELFNNVLYITFEVEHDAYFSNVQGRFTNEEAELPFDFEMSEEDLVLMERGDDVYTYLWPISFEEFDLGEYEGSFIITHSGIPLSQEIMIEPFLVEDQLNDEANVTWGIEEGLTSELFVEVIIEAASGTIVQVEDDGVMLTEEEIEEGQEKLVLHVPLIEGYRILEVKLLSNETQSITFARRYQVDHTPPRLEMIHPLPSHLTLDGSYVSGYIEPGSILMINGEEYSYANDGYFQIEIDKKDVELIATDKSGNETVYSWKPKKEDKESSLLFYILLNAGIIVATAIIIWFLRKRNKKRA